MKQRLRIRENKAVLLLTSLLLLIVAMAVGQSGWTDGLDAVVIVVLGAIVIGLLLSKSLLPGLISHLFSAVIGLGWSFWVVSQLLPDRFTWRLRWETMLEHITNWYNLAQEGGVIYDNLMFILQMALIIWILGYFTMWILFRSGKIWSAVVPSGVVLLINLYYAPENLTSWFIIYLLLALLLIVRFNLSEYEHRWRLEHVYFRSDISFDFLRNGLIFSAVVIALAWFTPAVSEENSIALFDRFDRQWRTIQGEWNRLFAGLNYRPQDTTNPNSYAQSHTLGGARRLSEQLVMFVDAPGGRYWRAAVYDNYDGNTWQSNDDQQVRFNDKNVAVALPAYEAREPFTQTYTTLQEGLYILYAMANPSHIDRSTIAKTNMLSGQQIVDTPGQPWAGRKAPWGEEITYIESDARLKQGDSYQVVSQRSVATKEQLRTDPADYPDWIKERYLKLPDTTTQRVLDLAAEITAGADNAYDKAEAIEHYMRNNISYNERLEIPPPNRDKVDYILFDLQEAYCDYYATSMIVMLRSQGIPARFAAGFARGQEETLDNQEQVYLVKNLDAHSWVEVYFSTYGWIEFEPTAAQPVIARRSEASTAQGLSSFGPNEDEPLDRLDLLEDVPPFPDDSTGFGPNRYSFTLPLIGNIQAPKAVVNSSLVGLFVLAIGTLGWRAWSIRNTQRGAGFITGDVYFAMLKLAHWMGLAKRPSQTPYEHAAILTETIPPIESEVNLITGEFVRHEFSPKPTTEEGKSQVLDAWEGIRPILYRAIFERRIPKIRLPFKW